MVENNKAVKHSVFHWSIHTEIIINAPKEKVWSVLTDFEEMPNWSNSLQKIEGELKNGDTIVHFIFKGKSRKLKHKIIGFEEGTQFGWSDPIIPLATDNHIYRLETLPDGKTRFIQSDEIRGGSTLFIGKMMADIMMQTYPEFNKALKNRVEQGV